MAKLLMNWLNNDVKLSSVIYSLEEDFKVYIVTQSVMVHMYLFQKLHGLIYFAKIHESLLGWPIIKFNNLFIGWISAWRIALQV